METEPESKIRETTEPQSPECQGCGFFVFKF